MGRISLPRTGPGIENRYADALLEKAAKRGCDALLAAQLRAGQHLLPINLANALGDTLGMRPGSVRAAAGDPTITKEGRHHA
ncbi:MULTISPECIES: hypothetical protein [unclassified Sphingomonas]|uniref:hypothetical protein n=1 Tax=unclassified Sphingomonas TaxID=196159 RepID=UPI002269B938|nr:MULTISPECIES: hypothetical protein [unclassified Sphingomonas]